jgi:hypothetical protein
MRFLIRAILIVGFAVLLSALVILLAGSCKGGRYADDMEIYPE